MPQSPDAKIVSEWALRLDKDKSQIRRLIKSGKLENRYPRPNEGPPLTQGLRSKIPVQPNYVEVNVAQRNRPPSKSLAGRLDATLGKDDSARQKLWHKLLALFNDRELTANQLEAFYIAFEVMAKSAKSPRQLATILREALQKAYRRMHGPLRKKSRNTELAKVKKAGEAVLRGFVAEELEHLSERDLKRLRQYARISREVTRTALLGRRVPRDKKWTQERIAKNLGLSKSGYRKFLHRMGMDKASRVTQMNQSHSGGCEYSDRVDW
jgi:hypothetical protein